LSILPVQVVWSLGSSFEILMAYLIIPRAGWRILVLVSALPMIFSIFSAMVCCRYLLPNFGNMFPFVLIFILSCVDTENTGES